MGLSAVLIVKGRGDLVYFLHDLQKREKHRERKENIDAFLWKHSASNTTALSLVKTSEQGVLIQHLGLSLFKPHTTTREWATESRVTSVFLRFIRVLLTWLNMKLAC